MKQIFRKVSLILALGITAVACQNYDDEIQTLETKFEQLTAANDALAQQALNAANANASSIQTAVANLNTASNSASADIAALAQAQAAGLAALQAANEALAMELTEDVAAQLAVSTAELSAALEALGGLVTYVWEPAFTDQTDNYTQERVQFVEGVRNDSARETRWVQVSVTATASIASVTSTEGDLDVDVNTDGDFDDDIHKLQLHTTYTGVVSSTSVVIGSHVIVTPQYGGEWIVSADINPDPEDGIVFASEWISNRVDVTPTEVNSVTSAFEYTVSQYYEINVQGNADAPEATPGVGLLQVKADEIAAEIASQKAALVALGYTETEIVVSDIKVDGANRRIYFTISVPEK